MKKFIVLLSMVFISSAFAKPSSPENKIYLAPENIQINHDKILVEYSGHLLSVPSISVDQGGLYTIVDGVYVIFCKVCENYVDFDNQSPDCPHPWFIRND